MKLSRASLTPILNAVKRRCQPVEVANLILDQCCLMASVVHGSLIIVDYVNNNLKIASFAGPDWTPQELCCRLAIGEGITGVVAATGVPMVCNDVDQEPRYVPLFHYVRSELAIPIMVEDKVWGIINLDGLKVGCFTDEVVETLVIFSDLVGFAFSLQEELLEQQMMIAQLKEYKKALAVN